MSPSRVLAYHVEPDIQTWHPAASMTLECGGPSSSVSSPSSSIRLPATSGVNAKRPCGRALMPSLVPLVPKLPLGNQGSPKLLLRDSREAGASQIVRSQAVYVLTERDEAGPHRPCVGGATDWPLPGASCQSQLSHRGKPGGGGALALRPYFNSSPGDAMAQSRRARRGRGVSEAARGGRRALGALPPNPQELSLYGHRHPHAAQMAEMPEAPMR